MTTINNRWNNSSDLTLQSDERAPFDISYPIEFWLIGRDTVFEWLLVDLCSLTQSISGHNHQFHFHPGQMGWSLLSSIGASARPET